MQTHGTLSIGGSDAVGSDSTHGAPEFDPKRPKRRAVQSAPSISSGQRLLIQQDERTGQCVYTVTDRDSGQVVACLSREDVVGMAGQAGYAAGALIKAKA